MTNYEKIKFLLEMGVYKGVVIILSSGETLTVSSFTEGSEGGHISDRYGNGWTKNTILNMDITSITPIPNPPKLLPVGTKIRVDNWIENIPLGEIIYIHEGLSYYGVKIDDREYQVPARAVVPVLD